MEFKIKATEEYIQLNNLLKITDLVSTGGEAHIQIEDEMVMVNGVTETRKRKKLRAGDVVEFAGKTVTILAG